MANLTTIQINNRFDVALDGPDSLIGQGGMGTVYKGIDRTDQTPVAVKVLRTDLIQRDPDMVARFQREGEALSQLNHPNIVKMLGSDDHQGTHYLVMEYVNGGSLRDVLEKEGRVSVQRALYIALDLADALTRAHRLNILHRDIKPDNVLIAEDGTPRLTDFGMARMSSAPHITQDGAIVGTMAYIPPEAFQDVELDERADIWAFGVMLFEMLVGDRPFPQNQPAQLINAIMTYPVPDLEALMPNLPTALVDLIYRMLAKDRAARIPSVRMIGVELESIIRGNGNRTVQPAATLDTTGRFEKLTTTPVPVVADAILVPNNLPKQPTPFVGRDAEIAEIRTLLADDSRLITILGPGGMGKTRLSLAVAETQLEHYLDGVFFVPLAPLEDHNFVVPTIADSIGYEFAGTAPRAELLDYLRSKHMLLVIDNYEHVMDGAAIVSDILKQAPNVRILVTSRERLRLRGEQIYEVDGMRIPAAKSATPDSIYEFASVQLFMQSARRMMPDFEVEDNETASDVAKIVQLVQGLPLGIELAAAWLEMMNVDEIASEIENSLDFLETDLRDVPERHRSIRAVFDYSWNLLSEDERISFLKLTVFRGGFEREAAQKVAGASLRTLSNFVNKSLLRRDPNGRYFVHKLLREYGAEIFCADDNLRAETINAHGMYYGEYLGTLEPLLNSHKEKAAGDSIEKELENIRYMWMQGIEHEYWHYMDLIQQSMILFYIGRSMLHEAYAALKLLADRIPQTGENETVYWRARTRQVWVGTRLGYFDEVFEYAPAAYEYFKVQNNGLEMSYALNQIAYAYMRRSDYDSAIEYSQLAIDAVKDHPYSMPWFIGMGNLGYAYYLVARYGEAYDIYCELDSAIADDVYSTTGIAYLKNNLGEILREIGDLTNANTLFQEAFEMFESIKQKRGMAFTLGNIGGALFMQGQISESKKIYERSYDLYREIGDGGGEAHALSALGNVMVAAGNDDKAKENYETSLAIRRNLRDKRGIADSYTDLAQVALNAGDLDEAGRLMEEAIKIRREIGDRQGEAFAMAARALALLMMGEIEEARPDIHSARELGEAIRHPLTIMQSYAGMGILAFTDGNLDEAYDWFCKALYISQQTELMGMTLFALTGIATISEARGDDQRALDLVTLILRYPRNYIGMVRQKATIMLDKLSKKISQEVIESSMLQSKTLILNQVVAEILAEAKDGLFDDVVM